MKKQKTMWFSFISMIQVGLNHLKKTELPLRIFNLARKGGIETYYDDDHH